MTVIEGKIFAKENEREAQMSPIYLSPGNRTVVVFGGGRVALRKCLHFKGFRIRVVAPDILPELLELADESVSAEVDPESAAQYMEGADIVIAATSSHGLNDDIRDLSLSKGIMTNSAHGGGDVLIPSVLKRPGYSVTVSSEGRVPAFPPYVIRALDDFLDPSYDAMLDLLMRVRPVIRDRIATQPERARFLADILDNKDVWALLREGREDDALRKVLADGGIE
jgi:siroheme synthase-like protein